MESGIEGGGRGGGDGGRGRGRGVLEHSGGDGNGVARESLSIDTAERESDWRRVVGETRDLRFYDSCVVKTII